ncbi:hypothetical protein [Methylobacterium planeticum]|uniref:hypothetical protein n=1 Tax=Methylobacterium planeticum TaxID=2615211 RepID=UPI00177FDB4D|nr:hypothetical protein [Methylobacterium planeticum]
MNWATKVDMEKGSKNYGRPLVVSKYSTFIRISVESFARAQSRVILQGVAAADVPDDGPGIPMPALIHDPNQNCTPLGCRRDVSVPQTGDVTDGHALVAGWLRASR